jgi:acyl-CoA thioester hydrolase
MHSHETTLRVRYAETDRMGVVYHANYVIWMEVGRVELCRSLGLRYRDMEEDGVLLAVAEVSCRFLSPARYDDEVIVKARVAEVSSRMIRFEYEMRVAGEDRILATGFTKHVFCNRELKRTRLPDKYCRLFGLQAS